MGLQEFGAFVQQYLLPQWPFFVVSFVIGMVGQFAKNKVWTKERAQWAKDRGKLANWFWFWARATLPLHGPIAGFLIGILLVRVYHDGAPAGTGIQGGGAVVLYYMGAGALSSFLVHAFRHFMAARGLRFPEELGDSDAPPPAEKP